MRKDKWCVMIISSNSNLISIYLDGILLPAVNDITFKQGMDAIGCSYDGIEFDNLQIRIEDEICR